MVFADTLSPEVTRPATLQPPAHVVDTGSSTPLQPHDFGTGMVDRSVPERWQGLNHVPFVFRHRLARHPLFELSRLAKLAELAIDRGDRNQYVSPEDRKLSKAEQKRRKLNDIHGLEEGNHWLKLAAVNRLDPEYDELLQGLLGEIEALSNVEIRRHMTWAGLTVFMNSPHLQVPYHFDHDTNFLMQIQGEKDVFLFDRAVLTEAEIEDFYGGNSLAGRFRDELKDAGTCFHLSPGVAVHHPPLAPHMVRNGSQVSISVAFFFCMPAQDAVARVYQSNHLLRSLGVSPMPPGRSPTSDRVKSGIIKMCSKSHPSSYDEMLYSGLNRITRPSRVVKRIVNRMRANP